MIALLLLHRLNPFPPRRSRSRERFKRINVVVFSDKNRLFLHDASTRNRSVFLFGRRVLDHSDGHLIGSFCRVNDKRKSQRLYLSVTADKKKKKKQILANNTSRTDN